MSWWLYYLFLTTPMEVPAEEWLDLLCFQIVELKQLPLGEYERRSSWFPSILVFLCLGSIWIGELVSFPFPVQLRSLLCPQDWSGCRSLVFLPSYLFYNFLSWPSWLFILDQSCSKGLCRCHCVPGFPASPRGMCCWVKYSKRQCPCRYQWPSPWEDHFRIMKKLGRATAENYSRAWQDESSCTW